MQLRTLASLFLALCLLISVTGSAVAQESPGDIIDVASNNEDLSTLVTALEAAGLTEELQGEGPFTLFAPTDAAFEALPEGTMEVLLDDPSGDLAQILLYHVVSGEIMAGDITEEGMATADTLEGSSVNFALTDDGLTIDGVNIVTTDIEADNGVIHVIDALILPIPEVPTDDVVDVAAGHGNFNTLVSALQSAALADALRGEGPFTLFAPTDAAFEELPEGTMDALLADPSGDLTRILLYHVVPGEITAGDITDGLTADTLEGSSVSFSVTDEGGVINDANIITIDLQATNGVVHGINSVLMPPDAEEPAAEATEEPAEEEPAAEATEEPAEEEPAAEATEEPAEEEPVAEATEEPADEEMAEDTGTGEGKGGPDRLPDTGGNFGDNAPLMAVVIGAVVIGLAGASLVRRRG